MITRYNEVSFKRFYFALFHHGLTLKTLKLAYIIYVVFLHSNSYYCVCLVRIN